MPIIKRYSNRKLYDRDARRYVTLDDVAKMIRKGQDVQVVDHRTEEDITSVIQAQIISREERLIKGGLPSTLFTNLIQASSGKLQQLHDVLNRDGGDGRVDAEIERRVRLLIERGDLKKTQAERLLEKLLALGEPESTRRRSEQETSGAFTKLGLASHSDVAALERQLEELTEKLKRLNARKSKREE